MGSSEALRQALVAELRAAGALRTLPVEAAFLAVPRERFLAELAARDGLAVVYANDAIPIKRDARGLPISSSSQPSIMAVMLDCLDVAPGQRVLEIGTGTGYNAALLAELAGPGGRVVSVELDPELAAAARAALAGGGHAAEVVTGDGHGGWAEGAPYDRVIVTASSAELPRAWHQQLAPGGRLVVPLRLSASVASPQAVVTMARAPEGFDPLVAAVGGFMPLRAHHDQPTPAEPRLCASEHGADGDRTLAQLSGGALAELAAPARRALLAAVLGPARRRPLEPAAPRIALELFVALGVPGDRLVHHFPGGDGERHFALGVLDAGGEGVAYLGGGDLIDGILAHGGAAAEGVLAGLVAEWRALGCPGEERLALGARYGDGEAGSHWRAIPRPGCTLVVDWRAP